MPHPSIFGSESFVRSNRFYSRDCLFAITRSAFHRFPVKRTLAISTLFRLLGRFSSIPVLSRRSMTAADYGSWESPVTGRLLTGGNCKTICELQVSATGDPFWVEQTFPQGKRVLFSRSPSGQSPVQWTSPAISVSNSVHEYGGGSFCLDTAGRVFICHSSGVSELCEPGAEPRPIVANTAGGDIRYADLFAHDGHIYAVQELHPKGGEQVNRLVRIDVKSGQSQVLCEGADFYAEPRVSPGGRWMAWIQWNQPDMSWESTSVRVMELAGDRSVREVAGNGHSNFGLAWTEEGLWGISDQNGSWNVHRMDHQRRPEGPLDAGIVPPELGEIGEPQWSFADNRPFVLLPGKNKAIAAVAGGLYELDLSRPEWHSKIDSVNQLGFTVFSQLCFARNSGELFCLASGPKRAVSLLCVDTRQQPAFATVVREARDQDELSQLPISTAQSLCFQSEGVTVQGYFYPPTSNSSQGTAGQRPPVLLFVHGGPTARTNDALDLKKQYFTSRGFAVFDINYRGSTGFGREFRELLNGQWGVADRDDMINGAKFLIDAGKVDPKRVCILGSSAGGFTALSVLFHPQNPFAAAVSIYGVSDLEDLCKASHKFEKENTMRLIAPYPAQIDVYRQRSPIHNIDRVNVPVAFLHGTDDPVVPVAQSEKCHEALKRNKVPTLLKLFPGEGHGFKKADTIAQSMDIAYVFLCRAMGISPAAAAAEEVEIDNL